MPARILSTITPQTPWGADVESPLDHLAQSAANAIDDLSAAIWTATTRGELRLLRTLARTLIERLDAAECTATTLDEHFDETRRR